jgi:DNA-binding LytR/AlgR family response regulator
MRKLGIKKFKNLIKGRDYSIIYCEAMGGYTKVHLDNRISKIISVNLHRVESAIDDENFIRTHKSFLVNLHQIESINFTERLIHLKDDHIARISIRNITNLKFLFTNGGKIEGIDFKHRQIRRTKST